MGIGHWLANKLSGGLLDTLRWELEWVQNEAATVEDNLKEAYAEIGSLRSQLEESQGSASNGWAAVQRWTDHANELEGQRDAARRLFDDTLADLRQAKERGDRLEFERNEWLRKCEAADERAKDNLRVFWTQKIKYNTANHYIRAVSGRVTAWIESWQVQRGVTYFLEKDLIISRAETTNERERIADYYIPTVERMGAEVAELREKLEAAQRNDRRDPETGRLVKSKKRGKV